MKSHASEKTRHLVLRGESGDTLPESLIKALDDLQVACGWMRGSGVLADVQLRAFDAQGAGGTGAPGTPRRIAGPVQAIALEGSVGFARGEVSIGIRGIFARETDRGMETFAGEIVGARVVALEALVTAFDDLALPRAVDPIANVWMLGEVSTPKTRASDPPPPLRSPAAPTPMAAPVAVVVPAAAPVYSAPIAPPVAPPVAVAAPAPPAPPPPAPAPPPAAPERPTATWSEAISASTEMRGSTRGTEGAVLPPRIARANNHTEGPIPEAGDTVEHFAFGRADVVKSDGERLHLRGDKDGRIREIALEMLKVTPLEPVGTGRRFRLDRKI